MSTYKIAFLLLILISCSSNESNQNKVKSVSEMKNVMWKGELESKLKLDSILPQEGFYGLGPLENLKGEITVLDGIAYVSTIDDNQRINVEIKNNVGAPFFVYTISKDFNIIELPDSVTSLKSLNDFLSKNHDSELAYLFKLIGKIENAQIHVQNLEPNTVVTSPQEAHAGQVNFTVSSTDVEIIGFYSNSAHGIYTHHDTNIHTHLISNDRKYMGHCDDIDFDPKKVKLYISANH